MKGIAMKLKNVLIVVSNIEKSKKFYHDLFGLEVILDNVSNVVMTEGLVLQEFTIWEKYLEKDVITYNNASELYFEDNNIEDFLEKLESYQQSIQFVHRPSGEEWEQKVIRFYDPDGNLIEVREREN